MDQIIIEKILCINILTALLNLSLCLIFGLATIDFSQATTERGKKAYLFSKALLWRSACGLVGTMTISMICLHVVESLADDTSTVGFTSYLPKELLIFTVYIFSMYFDIAYILNILDVVRDRGLTQQRRWIWYGLETILSKVRYWLAVKTTHI